MSKAQDVFNAGAETGRELSGDLPPAWPGKSPREGMGVAGKVMAYDSFRGQDGDTVGVVRLDHAVTLTPTKSGGALDSVGSVGVIISAGLRRKLGDAVMPVGSYVMIRYTGEDEKLNNMRTYDVYEVDKKYLTRLHEAVGGDGITSAPKSKRDADADGDDLPF